MFLFQASQTQFPALSTLNPLHLFVQSGTKDSVINSADTSENTVKLNDTNFVKVTQKVSSTLKPVISKTVLIPVKQTFNATSHKKSANFQVLTTPKPKRTFLNSVNKKILILIDQRKVATTLKPVIKKQKVLVNPVKKTEYPILLQNEQKLATTLKPIVSTQKTFLNPVKKTVNPILHQNKPRISNEKSFLYPVKTTKKSKTFTSQKPALRHQTVNSLPSLVSNLGSVTTTASTILSLVRSNLILPSVLAYKLRYLENLFN